ncbi:YktB family protein [Paenibacillus sp. GCM10027626]|uniref:YktB family protein n=1 Tax=Paenibacillus sp. GCM10027626 TaxID=3273411 RepID=UPI00363A57FB
MPLTKADKSKQPAQHSFSGFSQTDFDVFAIPGLEARMEKLIEHIRPKLHELGELLSPVLSELCGEEIYPHVAKHARRTINPPNDTWVAFAPNKRGYKAHPHFQIGLFGSHLFVQFAIIYEAANKAVFAEHALQQLSDIMTHIPPHFIWSGNHMVPEGTPQGQLGEDGLRSLLARLKSVKASEALCGIHIDRHDPLLKDGSAFLETAVATFRQVLPLYRMAF